MVHKNDELLNKEKHYDSLVQKIASDSGKRIDSLFISNELKTIEKELYMVEVPEGKAIKLFPSLSTAASWATAFAYKVIERFGKSKVINDYAKDFEKIALTARDVTGTIKEHGQYYSFTDDELEAASATGLPLDRTSSEACKIASDDFVNTIAFYGDETYNLPGLLSNANVPVTTAPLNAATTSRLFEDKSAEEMLTDLHDVVQDIEDSTNGVEKPDTIALAPAPWNAIFRTLVGTNSNQTVYQQFLDKNPMIKSIVKCYELQEPTAGWTSVMPSSTLSGDLMVAFKADPKKLFIQTPKPFTVKAGQREHSETQFDTVAKTGGLVIRYPLSVNIYQGV